MAKKGKGKADSHQQQIEELQAQLAAKEGQVAGLHAALADTKAQVQQLQHAAEAANANIRLDADVQHLLRSQRDAAAHYNDYENQVLVLELQSMVERYRIMDVDSLSEQNHELRNQVMQLNAENMDLSRALAESGQRARSDVARIHLALEAAARETLATARDRICRELHEQLDDNMRALVEEHGNLQESTLILTQQAASLDQQYRSMANDRRQFKIDSEVGKSMNDMQTRQVVLLKHQLERVNLGLQMLKVKCDEQTSRAESAESKVSLAHRELAQLQAYTARLRKALASGAETETLMKIANGEGSDLALTDEEETSRQFAQQLTYAQSQLARSHASRDRWRDRSHLYERACAQLQAALQTLQQSPLPKHRTSNPGHLNTIWSNTPRSPRGEPIHHTTDTTSPASPLPSDPSGVLGELSCFSGTTLTPGCVTPRDRLSEGISHHKLSPTPTIPDDLTPTPVTQPRLLIRPATASLGGGANTGSWRAHTRPFSAAVMPHTLSQSHITRSSSAVTRRPQTPPRPSTPPRHPSQDTNYNSLTVSGSTAERPTTPSRAPLSPQFLSQPPEDSQPTTTTATNTPPRSVSPQMAISRLYSTLADIPPSGQLPSGSGRLLMTSSPPGPPIPTSIPTYTPPVALLAGGPIQSHALRPRTALQPRNQRPGSVRYFSAKSSDPFLAMSELGQGLTGGSARRVGRPMSAMPLGSGRLVGSISQYGSVQGQGEVCKGMDGGVGVPQAWAIQPGSSTPVSVSMAGVASHRAMSARQTSKTPMLIADTPQLLFVP